MTMQKIAANQVAMSDFSDVPQNSMPARPNLPSRLLLRCIRWQEQLTRKRAEKDAPEADGPQNAAQEISAFLVRLRKAMDTPSFPLRLSSVPIRRVVTLSIPGAAGSMRARLFIPYGRVRGALLYLHGGGFVHCGLNSHYGICCRLARASGAAVLLPDYRLAPEHPFPAAIDDSQAALQWLAGASARYWGGKVAVAGDSAGGNLAAVLAQDGRAGLGPQPVMQVLYYPSLYGEKLFPSHRTYEKGYFLSRRSMEWYGDQYIQKPEHWKHPRFVPGLNPDLQGLPPAVIITAECDPMRDEGAAYAQALEKAGVKVIYRCYPGALHAFLNFYAFMPHGKAALRLGGKALKKAFAG
ncbi:MULTISPECIES: alpha/beta hydrolase [Acetobacter]|nr:alpha/beta hydrolase [Acetobacter pasteurianus]AKR47581.1 lipase [Acetobacter pasteurianus]